MGILNQIYKKYQLYKNKLYALGLFLYTSSVLLRSSAYQYSNNADLLNLIFSSLSYLSYLIMLVIFLINILENMKNIYKRPNLYIFILFIAFLIYITFKTDTKAIFYGFLVVMASKDIKFTNILKIYLIASISSTIIILFLSFIGYLPDLIFYRGTTARHSFGFFYSTQLSHIYFFNILAYCIYRNQLKRTEYFIIVIIASIIFITTGSRNAFILTIVFLICYYMLFNQNNIYIWCYLRRYKEKIIYISKHFYTISFGLSFISSMLYNQQSFIFTKLNELLNNRLILGYNAIINYGIHLFGNYIKWIGMTEANTNQLYNYVDNSFLQILLTNGFVFICILLYFFYLLMKKLIDIKNYRLLLCLIFIAIHSLIDPQLLNIEMNIFLVLLVPFIYQKIYKGEKL